MSYKKKYYKKKWKKGGKSLAKRVAKLEKTTKEEPKFYDSSGSTTFGTAGVLATLSIMAQGDTALTREGNMVRPKSLRYRIAFKGNAASVTPDAVRVIFAIDKSFDGVVPDADDLLENDDTLAFPSIVNKCRFRILRDIHLYLNEGDSRQDKFREGFIKFPSLMKIHYQGTDATDASGGKNQILIYIVSSNNTYQPTVTWKSRFKFTE